MMLYLIESGNYCQYDLPRPGILAIRDQESYPGHWSLIDDREDSDLIPVFFQMETGVLIFSGQGTAGLEPIQVCMSRDWAEITIRFRPGPKEFSPYLFLVLPGKICKFDLKADHGDR